jgi:hypothetical protein
MNDRDPAQYNEASETPDMSDLDSPAEVLAEEMQAQIPWKKLSSKQEFCMAAAAIAIQSVGTGRDIPAKPMEAIKRMLVEIIDSPTHEDAHLTAMCFDLAFGLGIYGGATQTTIAHHFGKSRAAVSRQCRMIVSRFAAFGIKPGPGMKSEAAVKVYAEREKSKPRRAKEPWRFSGLLKLSVKEAV